LIVIEREALIKLFEMIGESSDSLAELIESFLDESPTLLDQLRQASDQGDRISLGRAAHTLKSSARDFGAGQLSIYCEDLEKKCRDGMPEQAAMQVDAIVAECTAAESELNLHLVELRRGTWSK
jgi:HPt (histidine-containing phosphotransfer) domain-containing protein